MIIIYCIISIYKIKTDIDNETFSKCLESKEYSQPYIDKMLILHGLEDTPYKHKLIILNDLKNLEERCLRSK